TNTGLTDVDEFREMVVKAEDGSLVRLKDIATVGLGAKSTDSSVSMNGEHGVFIGVKQSPTGNPLTIVEGIRALLPELERNRPPSVTINVIYVSWKFVRASMEEVVVTRGAAVAIVVVVIFLFLGTVRSVLIPIVTIP